MARTAPFTVQAATNGEPITPDDTAIFASTRGIYVGGGGDIHVDLESGDEVTFTGALTGLIYPLRVQRVYATGTTATDLVALR